ncbi:RtcB family protein [bacterium]|nr:RtcB family protein [bacterium]
MVWIVIHSGSRNVGHTVAQHYIAMAHPEGKVADGAYAFEADSQNGKDYIMDMNLCLDFALENREQMINSAIATISKFNLGHPADFIINRTHNHAESKDGVHWIHRKGATHAEEGMEGVIPGNMRDGSFIVIGKGNPDSLYSSSHGAGRILGRKEAERRFTQAQVQELVKDVAVVIGKKQVEESPDAYKNIFDVMKLQQDLVAVTHHIKPILCVKG